MGASFFCPPPSSSPFPKYPHPRPERENISFRLQSGRQRYVERNLALTGKSGLGREGYRKPREQKAEEYKETLKLLRKGYPYRKVAKLCGVSESTVKRLKKEFSI